MITLTFLICSQINGVCVINTPHKSPYYQDPYETVAECNKEGKRSKKGFKDLYKAKGVDVDVKFRCIRWDPTT